MIFLLSIEFKSSEDGKWFLILLCITILFVSIFLYNNSQVNNAKIKNLDSILEYQAKYINYKDEVKNYEVKKNDYLVQLDFYKNEIQASKSNLLLRIFRRKLLLKFDQQILEPTECKVLIKKGASEDFFFSYLQKYFGANIHQGKMLGSKKLFPDFTYLNNKKNLCIDIEIDEPYIALTGKPIHHTESNDSWRDSMFSNHGWSTIRFTEKQVVTQPDNCCKLIELFIQNYIELTPINNELLINSTEILTTPVWTIDEANSMAYFRFRLTYLPHNLHPKTTTEKSENDLIHEEKEIEEWRMLNDPIYTDLPF